jgi:3-deoxy-manno-octulosonate cytidylyltransferase (CMP-KDO synthetase)
MNILDCTLRDGGYYTNWTFDDTLVKNMVKTLDSHGIKVIELGYKSPIRGGPYRKCNDGYIKNIINFDTNAKLAFMIDAKDFIKPDQTVDFDLLNSCVQYSHKSPFSICRLAIKFNEIIPAKIIANHIKYKGYELFINLMGISLLGDGEIIDFVTSMKDHASVLYFADSYGNLTPKTTEKICNLFYTTSNLDCGIHCHDNLGLAFANSLRAIESGFSYVDGTVCGMGRGVGNTRTEQLLLYSKDQLTSELLQAVDEFDVLKKKYKWGFNPIYMVAGMHHIHPLLAQGLTSSALNIKSLTNATNALKGLKQHDTQLLSQLIQQKVAVIIPARYKSSRFPGKPLAKIHGKEMILHVAEKCAEAVGSKSVYIATDNEAISSVVKNAGYNVILTSDNCLTGTDRIAEASLEVDADIIVNVQGDEPMISPNDIIKVIEAKHNYPNAVINCMSKLNHDENSNDTKIPKIVCDENDFLLYASRSSIPGKKTGTSKDVMKQVCIYAFSKQDLIKFISPKKTPLESEEDIEILRFIEKGIGVKMINLDSISYAVDYPEDIQIIESKLNASA